MSKTSPTDALDRYEFAFALRHARSGKIGVQAFESELRLDPECTKSRVLRAAFASEEGDNEIHRRVVSIQKDMGSDDPKVLELAAT